MSCLPQPICLSGQTLKRPTTDPERARLAALAQYQQTDALSENTLDRLTTLAARLFRVPTVFVLLIDDQRQLFTSRYALNIAGTARRVSFCDHTLAQGPFLCVSGPLNDPRFRDSPLIQGYPHIRFYAGIPLATPDGHLIVTVCLADTLPRPPLTDADRQHLADIAALIMDRMEVHRLESISATSPDVIICTDHAPWHHLVESGRHRHVWLRAARDDGPVRGRAHC
ncbi:hypothetical protein Pvag_pPag20128 (plasmid) [Pantoea vagans C9-1]|nr:hypothetical protein Pvag_pPag20128 [Pantoea vagans C9-1]